MSNIGKGHKFFLRQITIFWPSQEYYLLWGHFTQLRNHGSRYKLLTRLRLTCAYIPRRRSGSRASGAFRRSASGSTGASGGPI